MWQSKAGKLGNQACHILMKTHSPDGLLRNQMVSPHLDSKTLSESVRDYTYLILTSQTSTRGPIVGHEA